MPSKLPPRKDKNRVPRIKRAIAPASTATEKTDAERIAKVIARAGLGSRREIEEWIAAGRVAVNGVILESPAFTVTPEDTIQVDGEPLPEKERTRLFLYHKPKGVVTTNRDPEGRTTLFEILPKGLPRLVSIGRLDLNSEGLLLLTNDGGLARALELPETGWLRRYRVRAKGEIDQARLDGLLRGITVEGIEYGPIEATLDRVQGANVWITVALREGKNREVRNVLAALGMAVNRLIRVSYGPFQLGEIEENGIEEVRTRILRDQIGADIVAASGADFDGPLIERTLEEAPRRLVRPADEDDAPRRPARGPRRAEREPEGRARARHPHGAEEDTSDFRVRSRRADPERAVESRGTVADRKGREIKVERVVAPREEERPQRRSGPGRDRPQGGRFERDDERPRRSGPPGKRPAGPRRPDSSFEERPRGRRPAGAEGRSFERDDARRDDSRPPPRRPRPQGEGREDFRRGDERGKGREDARPRRREEGPGGSREGFRPRPRAEGPGAREERPRRREEGSGGREERPRRREEGPGGSREGFRPRSRAEGPGAREERPRRREEGPGGREERPRRREEGLGGSREGFRPRPRAEGPGAREERPRHREEGPGGREERPRRREVASEAPREDFRPWREERPEGQREERRERSGPPSRGAGPKARPAGGKPRGERRGENVGFIDREPRGDGPPRERSGPKGPPKGGPRSGAPRGGAKGAGPKAGGPKRSGPPRGGKPAGPRKRT
ncbi:pseudouridine synthase [Aquabacter sp. CN5-332]|uniref:pseudouridine synthase n=1 Tax=Aquabacter sp. CN5-332 TaxID=3156608 RepID=UPI0032B49B7E